MFSKTERNYLAGKYIPSITHRRVLNHRIRNKIKEYYTQEYPIIQNVTEFSNAVTEFSNTSSNYIAKESLGRGTNPRPNAYEALTQFIFVNLVTILNLRLDILDQGLISISFT